MSFNYCPSCRSEITDQIIEQEPRRACSNDACNFVHYENPTPVVAAIVEHEGEIILAHNREWPMRFFGLITGFLEKNELPEPAILREVKEELDLDAHSPTLIGHYGFQAMNQLIIAYHVHAEGVITLNHELDEYKRVKIEKLQPWPTGTGQAVADWLESKTS